MARLDHPAHELFAQHCARGKAQTEAYRLAGYAENQGNPSTLASQPEIAKRINEIKEVIAARAEASAERVLAELARVGFADITQVVEIKRGHVKIRDTAQLSDGVKAAISEIRAGREGTVVRFHDKGRALELLGKHLGLFKENIDLNVNISLADLVNGSYQLERDGKVIEHQGEAEQQVSSADDAPALPVALPHNGEPSE